MPMNCHTPESFYSLEIPFLPTGGISVRENTRIVNAPTYSLAPSAMLGWWTPREVVGARFPNTTVRRRC
jgi:hypothetical protein